MPPPLHLRVFLASPGDVADERGLALRVLGRLPYDELLRGRITLEAVAWDHPGTSAPMLGGMSAQDSVIQSRGKPSECHVVVVILWSRLGSPVADPKYAKPDGSGYFTGTEWEYEDAWQANQASKGRLPRLLLYRRTSRPKVELDPNDIEAIQRRCEQLRQVEAFFAAGHRRDGSLANPYQEPSDFERDFEQHLKAVIRPLMESTAPLPAAPTPPPASPPLWEGSPFPGLRAFTPADAPIFFGRGRETDGLVSRLAEPSVRFLAVVGASGSGKSSLVAAGLIPRLLAGALPGSQDWVWVRFTPGEVGDNPFMALAVPFKDALQQRGQPPRELAEQMVANPAALTGLRDLALAEKPAGAELLLFIDQFEELFTLAAPGYVAPFVAWLGQAAQTGVTAEFGK